MNQSVDLERLDCAYGECGSLRHAEAFRELLTSFPYPLNYGYNRRSDLDESEKLVLRDRIDSESLGIFDLITELLGGDRIPMIGYGSLMNPKSAKRSLSSYDAIANMKPVEVYGYQRSFNVVSRNSKRIRPLDRPQDLCVLNLSKIPEAAMVNPATKHHWVNAVSLPISREEFPKIRRREGFYDFVPVVVRDYIRHNVTASKVAQVYRIAYAWIVRDSKHLVTPDMGPIPLYFRVCGKGARGAAGVYGLDFLELYKNTTTFANGVPIRDRFREMMRVPRKR